MTTGALIIHWSARIAFLLYAAALAAWILQKPRAARFAWTSGLLLYLAHVIAAFHFRHHWSHDDAYAETARQTAALFGTSSGAGLYWNYVFTAVWAFDVMWIWWNAESQRRWIAVVIHSFIAFMFFNATVVFVSGWPRWMGLSIFVTLGILWWNTRVRGRIEARERIELSTLGEP